MKSDMPRAADPTADQPITRTILFDARLRQVKDIDRVEIREIRILPGYAAGLHVHNGPVVGSILTGPVTYQIDGQPASVLHAGDMFFEPAGERIAWFDAGDDGVTFLAYFLLSRPGSSAHHAQPVVIRPHG
jgi:quercetin dioxygenase-like cupin family protein